MDIKKLLKDNGFVDNNGNLDVTPLVKADFEGELTRGGLFSEFSADLLEVQRPYIPILLPYLK